MYLKGDSLRQALEDGDTIALAEHLSFTWPDYENGKEQGQEAYEIVSRMAGKFARLVVTLHKKKLLSTDEALTMLILY